MLTDFLLDHPWFSPTAILTIAVLSPAFAVALDGRPKRAWCGTALAAVPIVLLTLSPITRPQSAGCTAQWVLPTPDRIEPMANVALFVLPVLLAGLATRRPVAALLAGSAASVIIEAVQAILPGLGRSCDTGDWLSNTIGAAIGAGVARAALTVLEVLKRRGARPR